MEYTRTIVVIGGKDKNPAKLHTQLEPIRFDRDMSMAVTAISHGEIQNVHSDNNKIYLNTIGAVISGASLKPIMLEIPVGRYNSANVLLRAIDSAIKESSTLHQGSYGLDRYGLELVSNLKSSLIKVTPTDVLIYVTEKSDTPWNLVGVSRDLKPNTRLEIENRDLLCNIEPAFLYANIVENSYINGKLSRNLALVPLSLKGGCSFYEFNHPNYVPIVVKNFSDILLELRTMDGHYVPFISNCKTVISLDLKPINRVL